MTPGPANTPAHNGSAEFKITVRNLKSESQERTSNTVFFTQQGVRHPHAFTPILKARSTWQSGKCILCPYFRHESSSVLINARYPKKTATNLAMWMKLTSIRCPIHFEFFSRWHNSVLVVLHYISSCCFVTSVSAQTSTTGRRCTDLIWILS